MFILLGILMGFGLPLQTGINARLTHKLGSPYNASFVSFIIAFIFLLLLVFITEQNYFIPFGELAGEPLWIWMGGVCGVIFLTGNIVLFARLGGVQTVIFPVLGQILMGLIIDNFGLFYAPQTDLTLLRILGAILVLLGVINVVMAKKTPDNNLLNKPKRQHTLLWQIFGIIAGMLSTVQTAVNGHLGIILASPVKAAVISFIIGIALLAVICVIILLQRKTVSALRIELRRRENYPWWIWLGGILGGLFVLTNAYLSNIIGTGMTIIAILIGSTSGGLIIDCFGLLGSERKPVGMRQIFGIIIMIIGAAAIKLF
ncbi:DMT family transporter [Megamonas hypermegale]|uniref:DMT family transporter n=1 Tax=Megamonas hypermegale TaxID=158847 RepID=UPI0026EC750B|nr:DMT family transporter [Megamonas hypermegale]